MMIVMLERWHPSNEFNNSMEAVKKGERKIIQFLDKLGENDIKTQEMNARILAPLVFKALNGQEAFGYEASKSITTLLKILDEKE